MPVIGIGLVNQGGRFGSGPRRLPVVDAKQRPAFKPPFFGWMCSACPGHVETRPRKHEQGQAKGESAGGGDRKVPIRELHDAFEFREESREEWI